MALVDGPMTKSELLSIGYPLVPPGRAARRYDTYTKTGRTDPDRIAIAQRWLAGSSLHSIRQTGSIAYQEIDGETWVYLTAMGYRRFFVERRTDAETDESA